MPDGVTGEDAAKEVKKDKNEEEEEDGGQEDGEHNVSHPDPYYPPIIYLPEVVVNSG
jgi:hypothetical protein